MLANTLDLSLSCGIYMYNKHTLSMYLFIHLLWVGGWMGDTEKGKSKFVSLLTALRTVCIFLVWACVYMYS